MIEIKKIPKFKNYSNSKITKLKTDRNPKIIQIEKWPKLENDPNSKMTQIQKWPKLTSFNQI